MQPPPPPPVDFAQLAAYDPLADIILNIAPYNPPFALPPLPPIQWNVPAAVLSYKWTTSRRPESSRVTLPYYPPPPYSGTQKRSTKRHRE